MVAVLLCCPSLLSPLGCSSRRQRWLSILLQPLADALLVLAAAAARGGAGLQFGTGAHRTCHIKNLPHRHPGKRAQMRALHLAGGTPCTPCSAPARQQVLALSSQALSHPYTRRGGVG